LIVVRDGAGAYDVLAKDIRTSFSVKGEGARVVKVDGSDDERFTLAVIYPRPVAELSQFTLDQNGRGTVIWASLKNVAALTLTKGSLFVAACSK